MITHNGETSSTHASPYQTSALPLSTTSAFAAALSLGSLNFASQNVKPAKLTLTPHHLFFLLSRFEEVAIPIGPMNVRLENIHAETSPANYVSFLSQSQRSKARSDRDSIHSVSSVRSVMSGMSALWSNFGIRASNNAAKTEKAKAQVVGDLKYLYSAFTKIPCLRLSPDRKARLIGGYEEFPFDTAVPLLAFKNISALEVCDVDFRQFFGWDRLADQLRSLVLRRANVEDPTDLFIGIVLDDMDKRRRRSSKAQSSPVPAWPTSPSLRFSDLGGAHSAPSSPMVEDKLAQSTSPRNSLLLQHEFESSGSRQRQRTKSTSPSRPTSSRQDSSFRHMRGGGTKVKRSGSGSSNSSGNSSGPHRSGSSSNLLSMGILPASKWRFLRHLSLADNSLTSMATSSLAPLANTLHSLDLSSNIFTEMPDCLASLTALRALNLSNCMIESLHSLTRNPLPAITALNLRANRLASIAGIERLLSLERLDLRDNRLQDPTEAARLTGIPNIREIWVLGNPFLKTHSNYRIIIFNLFRTTPGFVEDIIVDALGPGYSERRQLKDRIAEAESVPVMKPILVEVGNGYPSENKSLQVIAVGDVVTPMAQTPHRPVPQTSMSEVAVSTGRRRKGPRRRIVDLSRDEGISTFRSQSLVQMPPSVLLTSSPDADLGASSDELSRITQTSVPQPVQDELELSNHHKSDPVSSTFFPPRLERSDKSQSLVKEIRDLNLDGEAYRQKVEALKHEVGPNWLSVLSEESWNSHRRTDSPNPVRGQIGVLKPEISDLRSSSQGIVSGGGTLG